ncbi:MAG: leucine-rich repeat protein [Lachnospiraceae bacterium]|nr:leucine-rich repeat protein [Lachnospiraceae bacterium]
MKKRLMMVLMAVFAVLGTFAMAGLRVIADEAEFTYRDHYGDEEPDGISITGYNGDSTEVVIPGEIDGKVVRAVYMRAFSGNETITSVTFPDTVTEIWTEAFKNCKSLSSVSLPEGLTRIDMNAFAGCSSLKEVVLPVGLETLGQTAFADCDLSSITIPAGVKFSEGRNRPEFDGNSGLMNIYVDEANENYCSVDGLLYSKDKKILFEVPQGRTSVKVPEGTVKIGAAAFRGSNAASITIPKGVTSVGDNAFRELKAAEEIVLPEGVESIGLFAFADNTVLKKVTVPDSVKSMDSVAFYNSGITIRCSCDSYAEEFAKSNYIAYELTDLGTIDIGECTVSLDRTAFAYTGEEIKPAVTVMYGKKVLTEGKDYTVSYSDNVKAGANSMVTVKGARKYAGTVLAGFVIRKVSLRYRAYVQKKNWMSWSVASVSGTKASPMAGTTDNLRMETIQMQLSGVSGAIKYRAYVEKMGWTQWATTADTKTFAGTKGRSRRVEMIQLKSSGEVATLYDMYYRTYCEKFGWLGWVKSGEKSGSAGYARKLEAFQINFVRKGEKFTVKSETTKGFYDSAKDGKNPK